jgi:hypothetical protein
LPFPVKVIVLELKFIVLDVAETLVKVEQVNAYPPESKLPFVMVIVDEVVKELPSVQAPPTPLKVNEDINETPLVVIVLPVLVEVNVTAALVFHTVPATSDIEPAMVKVGDVPCIKVTVPAETVISRQFSAPVIVTV